MSARTLLPKGDERLSQPWQGEQMDEENSVYEAEWCSADHMVPQRDVPIPAQETLLCSCPWQLDWYREEKEATAR